MQMPSPISAALNRTLLALSRARALKLHPPSPTCASFVFYDFPPSSVLHFAFISAVSLWFALLCGAWALSGSSKQAQIMNRVRKQLADYVCEGEREGRRTEEMGAHTGIQLSV